MPVSIILFSVFSISLRKEDTCQIEKVPAQNLCQDQVPDYIFSGIRCTISQNVDLGSFFMPLQSVILLV